MVRRVVRMRTRLGPETLVCLLRYFAQPIRTENAAATPTRVSIVFGRHFDVTKSGQETCGPGDAKMTSKNDVRSRWGRGRVFGAHWLRKVA